MLLSSDQKETNLVGSSIDTGPGVKNEKFMGLSISIHDGLQVFLILFAALSIHPNHRLTAARHCGLALWVDPGQHLHTHTHPPSITEHDGKQPATQVNIKTLDAGESLLTGILPFARKAATLFSSSSGMLTGTARVDGYVSHSS